jgi:hypothetical protein
LKVQYLANDVGGVRSSASGFQIRQETVPVVLHFLFLLIAGVLRFTPDPERGERYLKFVGILRLAPASGSGDRFRQDRIKRLKETLDTVHREFENRWDAWFFQTYDVFMRRMDYRYLHSDGAIAEKIPTGCKQGGEPMFISGDESNALFCEDDDGIGIGGNKITGTVYIPISPLSRVLQGNIWSTEYPLRWQDPVVSEHLLLFAIGLIAHESGHGLQAAVVQHTHLNPPGGFMREQFADCVAGDFVAFYEDRIITTPPNAELTNAIRTLGFAAIGDLVPPEDNGSPQSRRQFFGRHGFGEERRAAFEHGYTTFVPGVPPSMSCFEKYWPEIFG